MRHNARRVGRSMAGPAVRGVAALMRRARGGGESLTRRADAEGRRQHRDERRRRQREAQPAGVESEEDGEAIQAGPGGSRASGFDTASPVRRQAPQIAPISASCRQSAAASSALSKMCGATPRLSSDWPSLMRRKPLVA